MNKRRLTILRNELLRLEKNEAPPINYSLWSTCLSSVALRIKAFKKQGLRTHDVRIIITYPVYKEFEGFEAMQAFFELTPRQIQALFFHYRVRNELRTVVPPGLVAARITKMLRRAS